MGHEWLTKDEKIKIEQVKGLLSKQKKKRCLHINKRYSSSPAGEIGPLLEHLML